jgi:hypothetical protein
MMGNLRPPKEKKDPGDVNLYAEFEKSWHESAK